MLIQEVLDKNIRKVSQFTSKQLVFMMVLKCDVMMNIVDVQKQFGILDKDVNEFLQLLLAEKLISIENDKLTLTIKGEETLSQLWTVIENTEKQILSCFSTEEKNQFFSYLKRVSNNCISIIKSNKE